MPCATIHLVLAGKVLDGWETHSDRAPVPVRRPEIRNAFLHGALAPDMGFVPGADRLVSEVAHYLQPADLTRALLDSAESGEERAFAWGWASHVLGDIEIHPLVGRAVGERLYGDPDRRVDALEDVATHVSLEVGLDIAVLEAASGVPTPPALPHFDDRTIHHLEGALSWTYGVSWDAADLLTYHRRAVWLTRWWPRVLRILSTGLQASNSERESTLGRQIVGGSVAAARKVARPGSPAAGLFSARVPPTWVIQAVHEGVGGFPDRFQAWVDEEMDSAPNRNLETGGAAGPGLGHPASDAVARKVQEMRRTAGRALR